MTRQRRMIIVTLIAGCASGQEAPRVPGVRFANAPAVTTVDDRRDVPIQPAEREFVHDLYHFDGTFQRRLTRAMELTRDRRALGVNALDEVPDSTWFTNRIGTRALSVEQLRTGPVRIGSPESHKPWTVRSTKTGGTEPGLMLRDARGKKFMLKFDSVETPEQETAAQVITGRLLWACGFNVTEDHVVYFRPDELVIAPDAVSTDALGDKHPLQQTELERMLARVAVEPDGRIRGMASLWLDGKPVGGHPAEGQRGDDANDHIPHQLRRDLRGAYAMFAWLDHVDVQEGNFLDMWVEEGDRHYVRHYLLDFGKSLGVMETTGRSARIGHEYAIDLAQMLRVLFTAGVRMRTWEGRAVPALRGVGLFGSADFDPGGWKPLSPAYLPFLTADRFDKLWAAKIMIRFTREQLHAVVESGRLSDPRATEYLTETLVARQRATAQHWFARVNPLDRFTLEVAPAGTALCFDDLALVYRLGAVAGATRYAVTTYDVDARALGTSVVAAAAAGRTCTGALTLASPFGGYTMVKIVTERAGTRLELFVHLARDPMSGAPRVIGIWRS